MPGLEFIPGVRIPELRGLDLATPPILAIGVVGGTPGLDIKLSSPGDLICTPLADGTFLSNAITFADNICNLEKILLTTR